MGADPSDLATVSARIFASVPPSARSTDGSWDPQHVSSSLRALHASLEHQLATQEADIARVEAEIATLQDAAPRQTRALLDRLQHATQELEILQPQARTVDEHFEALVALLAPATHQLQTLDAKAMYLSTALEIERRSNEAKRSAIEATTAALDAFQAFTAYVATIPIEYTMLQTEAMRRVDELSLGIKTYAVEKLQQALEGVEWPRTLSKDEMKSKAPELQEIARAFAYLVTLHVSQLDAETPVTKETSVLVELWAMECVLEPIRMRFKYHFERTESKTNRVTKPEWWLSYVLDQTRAHAGFLGSILTPELKKHRSNLECTDAQVLFLRGLILTAMKKLDKDLAVIQSERVVFCHAIDEVLLFEQAVNDEFGYDSYASTTPTQFPRVVDVLTEEPKTLFAWTKIDVEYAKETLHSSILAQKDAWSLENKVPLAAHQFVALLDFMCRRFAHFSNEGHRYVYISQVLFALLHEFHQQCSAHARQVNVKVLVESLKPCQSFFAIVNAVEHVNRVLEAWDENPFFIELMRKVAESEKSRTEILKMHLEHSKEVLKNAAKAAKETIMAREEAVAVRQAIAGPGAMIGPTAAFSAAYSVGKSLFSRSENENPPADQAPNSEHEESVLVPPKEVHETEIDAEALLFSRTLFERQVRDYKTLATHLIGELEGVVISVWRRSLNMYRKSSMWSLVSAPECVDRDVSSELGSAASVLQRVLAEAHSNFSSDESFSQLWKPLTAALDDAIFSTVSATFVPSATPSSGSGFSLASAASAIGAVESVSPRSGTRSRSAWSGPARTQFVADMKAIASIFQSSGTKNPRAYLRKTFDLCRLVELSDSKRREVHEALRGVDDEGAMDQITTILEACNILTLTPQQVLAFCEDQLGLQ